LRCIREVHEEIGFYIPPERFEYVGRYIGPDHWRPNRNLHGEIFLARDVPIDRLAVTEGRLEIVALDELKHVRDLLGPPAKYALKLFLKR
jgi:8-oxo-dGTP pyrophosphatase MutT (NUDIX family)